MIEILIADDDLLFRTQLSQMIAQLPGYAVTAQASNGAEALALAEKQQPDLLITDVEMPDLDGVELVRRLKEQGSDLPVIVLSNYDSYQYVKSTLKNGALDYILKHELSLEQLREQLDRAAQLLQSREKPNGAAAHSEAEAYVRKNITALKNEFLSKLLSPRSMTLSDIEQHMEILDIHLSTRRIMTCLMTLSQYPAKTRDLPPEQVALMDYAVLNITEEILHDNGCGFAGALGGGQFLLLFSFDHTRSEAQQQSKTQEILSRLSFCMENYLNDTVSFCLDRQLRDIQHLYEAYVYIGQLQNNRFFYGEDCVLQEQLEEADDPLTGLSPETEQQLLLAMEKGSGSREILEKAFSGMENRQMSLDNAKMTIYDLISVLNRFAKKHQVPLERVYQRERSIEEIWQQLGTVQDAKAFFLGAFQRLTAEAHTAVEQKADSHYVRQVLRLIRTDYASELSLAEIAEKLGISQSYLSKIFKEEVGKSFVSYLTDFRVQRSIQLMQEHTYMLYEIAELCGFREYTYFTSVFKRKTGKTPREYMNSLS